MRLEVITPMAVCVDRPVRRIVAEGPDGHFGMLPGHVDFVSELVPGAKLSVGPGPYRHGNQIELVRKGALDISRAKEEFGWAPKFDIRSGLAAYIEALRGR